MWIRHRNKFISLIVVALASLVFSLFHHAVPHDNAQQTTANIEQNTPDLAQHFKLTEQRRIHVLFGDGTGGGHKSGSGKPGKTEFPQSWSDDKIISVITRIANDQKLPMRQSGKRYWLRMGEEDGLQIRVVLDRERSEIVTGYPVEGHRH
jgi:hypothetical protein